MNEHFTAWVTTTADCLEGDFCDVQVLRDEVIGYSEDHEGNETPDWASDGTGPAFSATLSVRHDEEDEEVYGAVVSEAETELREAGWEIIGDWESVTTGCTATVSRIN